MSITFTEPTANAPIVIAWGGHIASQGDWGFGNSASAISGSPYHMALDSLDGASTGSQDRALSTSAIFFAPTISTTLSSSSILVGASVTDSATLSGSSSNAGGTVTYKVYSDNTCTTLATTGSSGQINAQPGSVTVTNAVVPNSASVTFQQAGTYYWQATYSGDSINIGPVSSTCTSEQVVVGPKSPTISTTLSQTTGNIGDTVTDSATLSGATSNAGGTVTYTVYTDSACTQGAQSAGTKTVTNGVVPNSNGVQFNSAGTFYWQAVYSGDANNNGASSTCTSEQLVIGKNSPSISTILSETTSSVGDTVHDSATLTGATSNAGGTVTYTVYSDSSCSTFLADAGTKTVTNGVVPNSNGVQFNSAGTFYWQAVYSGDANNNGATSVCTSEALVISKNSPTMTTAQHLIPNDDATLTGATSSAGGTITFNLYSPSDATCSGAPALTQTVTVSGNGTYSTTNTSFVASDVGTWRWQVVYSGDSNNNGATSACGVENFTITNS
jgi:hypothetical protein